MSVEDAGREKLRQNGELTVETKKNLLLFLMKVCVVIVIIALPILIRQTCNAQAWKHQQDNRAEPGAIAELAADQKPVWQKKSAGDADRTIKARPSDVVDQLHEGLSTRKVRVGIYENRPKVFTSETGRPSGIFTDVLGEIAQKEKWELVYVPCEWPECLLALEEGRIDLMPDVAFSPERNREFDFNKELVIESWSQVYVRSGAAVQNLSDLNGRQLALLKDSIQQGVLEQMMNGFGYKVTFVQTHSYEDAFSLVANGTADAAVSNHFFGDYYCREYGLVKSAIIFNPVALYCATAPGRNTDLLMTIDRHLKSMKSEPGSIYYKALGKWMERPPTVVVPQYLYWVMGVIGGLLALAFVFVVLLRIQVRTKTRHLVQANETLRESENNYRNLFETMAQGVVYQDAEGAIISANPAAERILGLSLDEMRGLKSVDPRGRAVREDGSPFPGEEHPAMVALRTGKAVSGVIMGVYHSKTDETRWILVDATPDFSPGGTRPSQVYTMFADITDRKRAEESLRNQHRELAQIFDTLPDALVYADVEQRIVRVNPAFVRIFGYEPGAVIGKKTAVLYKRTEDFEEQGRKRYNVDALPSYEPYDVDYRRANGEVFTGETVGSSIFNSKGELVGMFGLVRDISERRRLESQLEQAQKMESVGRLAGGVAHDFNNLLSIILGYGEMLLNDFPHEHPSYESLENIVQAAMRAKDLTRQLLAFSRKQVLEMHPVNVNNVVTGFERLLRRVIGEDIALELTLATDPCRVVADTGQLEQVFMNLAVNARDAMPDGGTLTIETALTELEETYTANKPDITPGEYVMISISDTGHGMDTGTLEHIFEPFFTTKGKEKGTGLGLATSYGIIKQHGGSIWVYSEPGIGTTFKIYLPLCKENTETQKKDFQAPINLKGTETILLVEDNEQVRQLAFTILSQYGYTVLSADSGEAALAILDGHAGPLDVLLTDVVMPGMNGTELFDRIPARFPKVKALYMSGYTDDLIAHRGVLEKGLHFIQKPFSVKTIAEKVRAVLDESE